MYIRILFPVAPSLGLAKNGRSKDAHPAGARGRSTMNLPIILLLLVHCTWRTWLVTNKVEYEEVVVVVVPEAVPVAVVATPWLVVLVNLSNFQSVLRLVLQVQQLEEEEDPHHVNVVKQGE